MFLKKKIYFSNEQNKEQKKNHIYIYIHTNIFINVYICTSLFAVSISLNFAFIKQGRVQENINKMTPTVMKGTGKPI